MTASLGTVRCKELAEPYGERLQAYLHPHRTWPQVACYRRVPGAITPGRCYGPESDGSAPVFHLWVLSGPKLTSPHLLGTLCEPAVRKSRTPLSIRDCATKVHVTYLAFRATIRR